MRTRHLTAAPTHHSAPYRVTGASVPYARSVTVGGTVVVTLYATAPTGPWASRPADLAAWQHRHELGCRGEASTTIEGRPLEAAARGRTRAIRSRRAAHTVQRKRRRR